MNDQGTTFIECELSDQCPLIRVEEYTTHIGMHLGRDISQFTIEGHQEL